MAEAEVTTGDGMLDEREGRMPNSVIDKRLAGKDDDKGLDVTGVLFVDVRYIESNDGSTGLWDEFGLILNTEFRFLMLKFPLWGIYLSAWAITVLIDGPLIEVCKPPECVVFRLVLFYRSDAV